MYVMLTGGRVSFEAMFSPEAASVRWLQSCRLRIRHACEDQSNDTSEWGASKRVHGIEVRVLLCGNSCQREREQTVRVSNFKLIEGGSRAQAS
jgi:aminoglycoside phosphotransferase